jgi:hypothetical protein
MNLLRVGEISALEIPGTPKNAVISSAKLPASAESPNNLPFVAHFFTC